MQFPLADGRFFEIPDEWWIESGMNCFVRSSEAYLEKPLSDVPENTIILVPINSIKPIRRDPGVTLDFGGFGRERLVRILGWIAKSEAIEPVKVLRNADDHFLYSVYDGFHRFHASVAAGFPKLPVSIGKWGLSWDQ